MMIGCTFAWHARFQPFTVRKIDVAHPSMQGVPNEWKITDELYFGKELYPVTNVMMAHQTSTLDPSDKEKIVQHAGAYSEYYPAVWYNHFQGGHVWVSTLGHSKETYSDPVYRNHLLQGLRFIASKATGAEFGKAFAKAHNDNIR
jgi:type 1 glutamine amidotransferase